eukprot:3643693-Alexandrium_andersonii.AAC.1
MDLPSGACGGVRRAQAHRADHVNLEQDCMVAGHAERRGIVGRDLPRLSALPQAADEAGDAG